MLAVTTGAAKEDIENDPEMRGWIALEARGWTGISGENGKLEARLKIWVRIIGVWYNRGVDCHDLLRFSQKLKILLEYF